MYGECSVLKFSKNKQYTWLIIYLIFILLSVVGCKKFTLSGEKYITLIGTADLQGFMEPHKQIYEINGSKKELIGGGISRIATILQDVKYENPFGTFVVSSGDDLMGRYFHTFKGKAIYSLMNQSGYMLYAPGNHEFDKGPKVFSDALNAADFQVLCSDLEIKGTSLENRCIPYKIVNRHNTKIGFFSLMTEDFPLITSPGKIKLKSNNLLSSQKMVKTLKEQHCNLIIALTHIGLEQDKYIAKQVKGIDIIFGGHSHEYTKKLVKIDHTLIVNAGEEGSYVVKLIIPLDDKAHIIEERVKYALVSVIDPIEEENSVQTLLSSYKDQLPPTIVLGKTTVEWDLTTDALRKKESNVANLVNDLLKDRFDVDLVMNNAGAFRGKKVYPSGNITDIMLHEIDAFSNNVYRMNISGKYIRQILEHSAASYDRGGLMQVSGIRYMIDLNKTAQVITYNSDGTWEIVKEGKRVLKINLVNTDGTFSPLDESKNYKILSNAYLVEHAGDGYYWFSYYGTEQKNTYTTFYTMMAGYLETHTVMNPKPLDGRLKIIP